MLCSIKTLEGCAVVATDGAIGHVRDFLCDDRDWVVRHLVVECGHWLTGRKVLISPLAVSRFDAVERVLSVALTKDQVRRSPDVDTDRPVSRRREALLYEHYGYPVYWGAPGYWGGDRVPNQVLPGYGGFGSPEAIRAEGENAGVPVETVRARDGDPHLRSCREVMSYHACADDGDVGHVNGMLVDDGTWAIRYFIVDTSDWWIGHRVLVAPAWVEQVSWVASTVSIHLSRDAIRQSPPYDAALTLSRAQEADVYRHYGRPAYWLDQPAQPVHETV